MVFTVENYIYYIVQYVNTSEVSLAMDTGESKKK